VPRKSPALIVLTNECWQPSHSVVKNAEHCQYSFVRKESTYWISISLPKLGGEKRGLILKIETREGFDHCLGAAGGDA